MGAFGGENVEFLLGGVFLSGEKFGFFFLARKMCWESGRPLGGSDWTDWGRIGKTLCRMCLARLEVGLHFCGRETGSFTWMAGALDLDEHRYNGILANGP